MFYYFFDRLYFFFFQVSQIQFCDLTWADTEDEVSFEKVIDIFFVKWKLTKLYTHAKLALGLQFCRQSVRALSVFDQHEAY